MANGRIFRPDALQANSARMRRGLELLDCVRLIRDTPGAWSSITIYIEMVLAYYSHEYTYLSLTAPGVTIVADRKTIMSIFAKRKERRTVSSTWVRSAWRTALSGSAVNRIAMMHAPTEPPERSGIPSFDYREPRPDDDWRLLLSRSSERCVDPGSDPVPDPSDADHDLLVGAGEFRQVGELLVDLFLRPGEGGADPSLTDRRRGGPFPAHQTHRDPLSGGRRSRSRSRPWL